MAYRSSYRRTFRRKTGFKSRRFIRRRNFRRGTRLRGGRTRATAISHGPFQPVDYSSRRLRQRTWRNQLWKDTIYKPHYKGDNVVVVNITTPASQGASTVTGLFPEKSDGLSTGTGFWLAPMINAIDTGVTAPLFAGDLVLRGGTFGINFTCDTALSPTIKVSVYLVFTVDTPDLTLLTSPQNLGWDPQNSPDFTTRMGKVLLRRDFFLNFQHSSAQIEHRFRIRKVDQARHNAEGKQFLWVVQTTNLSDNTGVVVDANMYCNYSFSGDAIGTT